MANTSNTSSIFKIVASITAVLLIAAATLSYFQGGGGSSQAAELAALSQAIPAQAAAALNGTGGGFARLDSSLKRLAQLRRSAGASTPGSSSAWQELESRAAAILAKRADAEALIVATANVSASAAAV